MGVLWTFYIIFNVTNKRKHLIDIQILLTHVIIKLLFNNADRIGLHENNAALIFYLDLCKHSEFAFSDWATLLLEENVIKNILWSCTIIYIYTRTNKTILLSKSFELLNIE